MCKMNDLDKLREEQNAKEHKMILDSINEIKKHFVRIEEFKPIKMVVYGMLGAIGLFFLKTVLVDTINVVQAFF